MHIVLSIHREMRMDLNQNTVVSQEYCTGFVDCRHINSRTSYHTVCATGYWKKLGGTMLKVKVDFAVSCAVDALYK